MSFVRLNPKCAGVFLLLVGIGALFGCATPGRSSHTLEQASGYTLKMEKIVNRPLNQVWDELVKHLSKSSFVINTLEKESRIIQASFYSDTPEKFVDCGKTRRTYARGTETQEYIYEIAGSSSYKTASSTGESGRFPVTSLVHRKTSLDGRMRIQASPDKAGTIVTVSARYVLTASVTGSYVVENAYGGQKESGNIPPMTYTCGFNADQPNTCNWASGQQAGSVTCQSKGVLEARILSYIK